MSQTLRWGILGTGNIARQFCAGVVACRRGRLAAVGSRRAETAGGFAAEFRIPAAYGGYEGVLSDAGVDAVYVALPNSLHHEWTIRALQSGKHVLCEKPLAMDAAQATEMFDEAGRCGRVLMEAFMYRTHPLMRQVAAAVEAGRVGQVRVVRSSFCFRVRTVEGNIRFDRAAGGGALMDVGCYCVNFSRWMARSEPMRVNVIAQMHPSGVDEIVVGTMEFPTGVLASFTCGMGVQADNSAYVCGTEGYVQIPVPWKPPARGAEFVIAQNVPPRMDSRGRKQPPQPPRQEVCRVDADVDLYGMEADAFAATVLDHDPPAVTREDTLGNMRVLDEMRRQVGGQ